MDDLKSNNPMKRWVKGLPEFHSYYDSIKSNKSHDTFLQKI